MHCKNRWITVVMVLFVFLWKLGVGAAFAGAEKDADKMALTKELWPKSRIPDAIGAVEKQRRDGLRNDVQDRYGFAVENEPAGKIF